MPLRLGCLSGSVRRGLLYCKGLYDIDAFEQALAGRMPENAILSHDLLEPIGRAHSPPMLLSSNRLPIATKSRPHASIDGRAATAAAALAPGGAPLSLLGSLKIFDNLRRTLVPPATLLALIVTWMLPAPQAWWWTCAVNRQHCRPRAAADGAQCVDRPRTAAAAHAAGGLWARDFPARPSSVPFSSRCYRRALRMMDAIVRTLYRLFYSRRPSARLD